MRRGINKSKSDSFHISCGKRGVSEIVSYVLLISITFAISGMIYSWLVFYVTPGKETKCDEGISLTIRSYYYNCSVLGKPLNITLQNRGLFDFDGYLIRVSNQTGAVIGTFTLNMTGKYMNTSEVHMDYYRNSTKSDSTSSKILGGNITFVEVQPFTIQSGQKVFCNNVAKQQIFCS